ncbi:photosystem reaction center subunit H [Synechococcales cyanobacterium C]|uniref:Photosystem reaction center subunit H n=1 Tax=Petrachloros mirabilis ULC683 TaxID=2781853 RepID=A0A8K2ABR8_9CYAN|nr:PRC-barrel domain-containing protein [Petrachloros mirabilis]NCJ05058.1 photosystem reaction center subunit H [Petrachloros mirabilis ULC683]
MAADSLKQSDLLNRLILDRQTTEELGRFGQLLIDPHAQRVVGFICKSGFMGSQRLALAWSEIESIGKDSILVKQQDSQRQTVGSAPIEAPIGHEIWTDQGERIGKVVDLVFASDRGDLQHYIFTTGGWKGIVEGLYQIPPLAVSSLGKKRIIVLDSVAQAPQRYTEGLGDTVTQVADFLKEDVAQTQQDVAAFKEGAQKFIQRFTDKDTEA